MSEKNKQEEVKVEDRRYFDRDGNPVGSMDQPQEEPQPRTQEQSEGQVQEGKGKLDFVALLFSFVHTALVHLGEVKDPIQQKVVENLEGARQMIDTLELLQQKTKGNLTQEEEEI